MASLIEKIDAFRKYFSCLGTPEQRYHKIIEMGKKLAPLSPSEKVERNLVRGCQSRLYLHSRMENGKIFFTAEADALISAGLAAILIEIYSGEAAETILQHSPQFLSDLGIVASLSPNRAGGLSQIHLRMKQEALKYLVAEV